MIFKLYIVFPKATFEIVIALSAISNSGVDISSAERYLNNLYYS